MDRIKNKKNTLHIYFFKLNASSVCTPGIPSCSTPSTTPRMNLNSSVQVAQSYCSIQLLGLEMLLHWLVGPEVTDTAARENLQLSLGNHTRSIV